MLNAIACHKNVGIVDNDIAATVDRAVENTVTFNVKRFAFGDKYAGKIPPPTKCYKISISIYFVVIFNYYGGVALASKPRPIMKSFTFAYDGGVAKGYGDAVGNVYLDVVGKFVD